MARVQTAGESQQAWCLVVLGGYPIGRSSHVSPPQLNLILIEGHPAGVVFGDIRFRRCFWPTVRMTLARSKWQQRSQITN